MAFIPLKGENGVEMGISNGEVRFNFALGGNVRLINQDYNPVRKAQNAVTVEWMVRGEEALRDFMGRISLRYSELGSTLKQRLKNDLNSIRKKVRSFLRAVRNKHFSSKTSL